MGIMLPHDRHPQQKPLLCQPVSTSGVVCSIEILDLLAFTNSLKVSTNGEVGHCPLPIPIPPEPPLKLGELASASPISILLLLPLCLIWFLWLTGTGVASPPSSLVSHWLGGKPLSLSKVDWKSSSRLMFLPSWRAGSRTSKVGNPMCHLGVHQV